MHEYVFKAKVILHCEYTIQKSLYIVNTLCFMHLLMNPQFSRIYSQTTSNNSGQAIIVHFYLSDETHEKNTEINCVRCTDKPPDSEDFFFFFKVVVKKQHRTY